jgi:hypothetical protein
MPKELLTIV